MESILRFTPDDLYNEIVLLDDGSGDEKVQKHAARYLADSKFKKVKAFRSDSSDGPSLSRFKASKIATGTILVFLSSDTIVTRGWIQPLIHHVQKNRQSIVVPHVDSVLSGFRYFKTPENMINVFSLSFTTLFYELPTAAEVLDTPVMTGAAFAVGKQYLDSIGSFDDGLGKGGGENLELSLRIWMCGGSIQINTCSRVAVRNALAAKPVESPQNFQRIAELWLGDQKRFAFGQRNHGYDPNEPAKYSLKLRRQYLQKTVQCRTFSEYLERVAPMIKTPPVGSRYFGQIRSKTGYCVVPELLNHGRMKMEHCKPHIYDPLTFFDFDNMGRISRTGKCIEMKGDGEVRFNTCEDRKADQMWEYGKEGWLESASQKNRCLAHYYDQVGEYSYLKVQNCVPNERSMLWTFVKY